MVSFTLFVILCVPLALVENYAGLLVLRFLVGFMGSPCLATGGATMQDMVCGFPASRFACLLINALVFIHEIALRVDFLGGSSIQRFLFHAASLSIILLRDITAPALGPVLSAFAVTAKK